MSVTMVSLYTLSLASSVLYTVTLYPVISPLGWVGGLQEMSIFSVCILVPGSKDGSSSKDAVRPPTGPGSKWRDREKEAIYTQYAWGVQRGEGEEGGREERKDRGREGRSKKENTNQLQVIRQ